MLRTRNHFTGYPVNQALSRLLAIISGLPVKQFKTEASARKGIAGLVREINFGEIRFTTTTMTVAELVEHYRQRELIQDNTWKSYSTKRGYESYLRNWIVPHWGTYKLREIKTIEVETWLRGLSLARPSSGKSRNIFSVLFNHARRYDLFDRNPITRPPQF